ncbi:MAG: hypothetical protein QNI84_10990 [Henriciella sp.]|nr:hypothetical protein [Henriciella sp.]
MRHNPFRASVASVVLFGIAGCTAIPNEAEPPMIAGASPDFFFDYDVASLRDRSEMSRLYSRLQVQADRACAGRTRPDCSAQVVARVVNGISEPRLVTYHQSQQADAAPLEADTPDFTFHFKDDEVDTFARAGRLYDRLEGEATAFCATHEVGVSEAACQELLIAHIVDGVDDRMLNRRYESEQLRGRVIVSDPIFGDEEE